MSCITEILKLKGNKEFLPIVLNQDLPNKYHAVVEGGGSYKDYEYLITCTYSGTRCGYVAIPSNYKFYGKSDADDIINCHGGITFFSDYHPAKELLKTNCTDFWIGFDCFHAYDIPDIECKNKYFKDAEKDFFCEILYNKQNIFSIEGCSVRNFDYVENECKSIIEQLINLKN